MKMNLLLYLIWSNIFNNTRTTLLNMKKKEEKKRKNLKILEKIKKEEKKNKKNQKKDLDGEEPRFKCIEIEKV